MPDLTPNLGIKKPTASENVSRASFNENWDIIDAGVAPKNKAQMVKLTGDDGYVTVPSATDLNNLTTSGFYYGNNLANAPEGTVYHRIVVMMASSNSGIQEATTNGGNRYIRNITSGVWSRWVLQLNDNAPTWFNLALQNGITAASYSGVARTPRYTKVGKLVTVEGEISGVSGTTVVIATLPTGYRPPVTRLFKTAQNTTVSNDGATIYVDSVTGNITLQVASNSTNTISLCGISFYVD
jgi:hypothetical protein